jgi:hypothetical protein
LAVRRSLGGPSRRFFASAPLITCALGAVAVEVLILFGLRPVHLWAAVAVVLVVSGAGLAWIDKAQSESNEVTKRIGYVSLIFSILSFLVALVTYVGTLTAST